MRPTVLALVLLATAAHAQWQLQDAHTSADLRGIDNVGGGVAWASGTNGTVLRTEDAGFVWQLCAIPPGAEHLDFRAVQAFDNNTAIVMSSGKGDLSRLYKTTDGCQTWTLLFTNPDKDGFWDALSSNETHLTVLGDPVGGHFTLFTLELDDLSVIHPKPWYGKVAKIPELQMLQPPPNGRPNSDAIRLHLPLHREHNPTPLPDEAFFAASNTSYIDTSMWSFAFVSGGPQGARAFIYNCGLVRNTVEHCDWLVNTVPLTHSKSSGAFSIATNRFTHESVLPPGLSTFVVVGGDYTQPTNGTGTAASSTDSGQTWFPATTPPHGYRSAVAYDPTHNTWITVGPNGTDISTDDGRNWRPLKPGPLDPPDADQHWNALSLPYVVGPHGRVATLRPDALPTSKTP